MAVRACVLMAVVLACLVGASPASAAATATESACVKHTFPSEPARTGTYCYAPLSKYPSYKGWGVSVDHPTPMPCGSVEQPYCMGALMSSDVWKWNATGWTKASIISGFDSYGYPYASGWRWVYQSSNKAAGAWYAVELNRLYVDWFVRS
jgi:hypothetical protein